MRARLCVHPSDFLLLPVLQLEATQDHTRRATWIVLRVHRRAVHLNICSTVIWRRPSLRHHATNIRLPIRAHATPWFSRFLLHIRMACGSSGLLQGYPFFLSALHSASQFNTPLPVHSDRGPMIPIPDDLTIAQFVLDGQHPTRPSWGYGRPLLIEEETGREISSDEVNALLRL